MTCVEKLRVYAEATKWGGECRILHVHHEDFGGDCQGRECGECRAAYLRAVADGADAELRDAEARLMPEGMAWPTVDGEPVDFNTGYEPSLGVLEAVSIYSNGACEVMSHDGIIKNVKDIHIARPKVLGADGAEIRVKETVFDKNTGEDLIVTGFEDDRVWCEHRMTDADALPVRGMWSPGLLTHERPETDSWERLEEDADATAHLFDAFDEDASARIRDLVRRAKALAEKEAR